MPSPRRVSLRPIVLPLAVAATVSLPLAVAATLRVPRAGPALSAPAPTPAAGPTPTPAPAVADSAAPTLTASPAPLGSSPLVDFYTLTRAGADAMQTLTLRLRADGIASLRTEYSIAQTAAGTPVTPLFETGTWRLAGGIANVHLDTAANLVGKIPTNLHYTSVDLSFALVGCTLKLVADPAREYGTVGLTFTKKSCGN